jgi:hypothetical protein
MNLVKMLPPTPSSRVDMDAHYYACKQAADYIARQIIVESDHQRASRDHFYCLKLVCLCNM